MIRLLLKKKRLFIICWNIYSLCISLYHRRVFLCQSFYLPDLVYSMYSWQVTTNLYFVLCWFSLKYCYFRPLSKQISLNSNLSESLDNIPPKTHFQFSQMFNFICFPSEKHRFLHLGSNYCSLIGAGALGRQHLLNITCYCSKYSRRKSRSLLVMVFTEDENLYEENLQNTGLKHEQNKS